MHYNLSLRPLREILFLAKNHNARNDLFPLRPLRDTFYFSQ